MSSPTPVTLGRRSTRSAAVLLLVGALALSACSSGEPTAEAAAPSTTSAPTTTAAPTTTTTTIAPTTTSAAASTTTSTTSTTSTTFDITTVPPATTAPPVQETEPIAPPADAYAAEPVITMGSIKIPKIGVDMTMYEGIRLSTLDYGPGHWPGTALPGQVGNVVVGGHRTSKHKVFRNVDQLEPGDEIIYSDAAGDHVYHVTSVEVIEPTEVWIVNPTPTATTTLFACHPPGSTAQRIAVFAELAG